MRRYGFEFVKGSGADYNARNVIEALILGAIICFPFLIYFNSKSNINVGEAFLSLIFLYSLFGLFAEILPKTTLSISLLFSSIIILFFSVNLFNELIKTKPENINIIRYLIIMAYATFVSIVNADLLKSFFNKSKIE